MSASATPPESGGPRDVGTKDFSQAVLERSRTVPVVVDFWAPWCGPCRVLGPVLEREVAALGGRVEMVKVNTDENQELAYEYGIQGIPAVKAFKDGKVAAEFVGAVPAAQVQKFLRQLAPPQAVSALDEAVAAARAGRHGAAEAALRRLVDDPEVGNKARLALARVLAQTGKPAEARAELASIDPRSAEALELPMLERRLAFASEAEAYGGEAKARAALAADGKDLEARYALASALAARGELAEALEQLLEIVSRNRKFKDDGARLAMLALFDQLGNDHDLTQDFRRRLQIVT
jgi:putative thioredoxin